MTINTLLASAVAAAVAWAGLALLRVPQTDAVDMAASVTAPATASAAASAPYAPRAQAPRPSAASITPASLATRIERLRASADPRDAYRAYRLIAGCLHARAFHAHVASLPMTLEFAAERAAQPRSVQRVSEACQDITPLQVLARIHLAERAAHAGVPGAAAAWTSEGPFGDKSALAQRPDDPLVVEWAHQALEMIRVASKLDDAEAIGVFGLLCMNWELDEIDRLKLVVRDADERELRAQADSLVTQR